MVFEETTRDEWACDCGCGKKWLVSRGQLTRGGAVTPFIAMPMTHGESRLVWLAIGAQTGGWAFTRSWLRGEDITGAVVDPGQSPLAAVQPFTGNSAIVVSSRQQVVSDQARTKKLFEVHDEVLRNHADLRHVFDPRLGRDFTLKQPDCVFGLPPEQWSNRNSKNFSELGDRTFVRALLPVPVSDGSELRVGVWVEVPNADFETLLRVFWSDEPAYARTAMSGTIENSLSLLGHRLHGVHVRLAPRSVQECLFVVGSDDARLGTVMRDGVSIRVLPEVMAELQATSFRRPGE